MLILVKTVITRRAARQLPDSSLMASEQLKYAGPIEINKAIGPLQNLVCSRMWEHSGQTLLASFLGNNLFSVEDLL